MLHEISRNHDADGVKTSKERDGDAVEAHCGNGACRLEVFDTREIEKRRSEGRKRARNRHCKDNIAFIFHSRVFCREFIVARCFQFVPESRFVHYDKDDNRNNYRENNRNRDVFVFIEGVAQTAGLPNNCRRQVYCPDNRRFWSFCLSTTLPRKKLSAKAASLINLL